MRAAILAASLLALASAQRLTTTDDTGETIVVSIATDRNGDPTLTRTLSTITPTDDALETDTTTAAALTKTPASITKTATKTSTSKTSTTTSKTKTTTPAKGNVAAPVSNAPMTATTYWYPDPADPSGEWIVGTWSNSFVPITEPTAAVPEGTIATDYQPTAAVAAANNVAAGTNAGAHAVPGVVLAGVVAGAVGLAF